MKKRYAVIAGIAIAVPFGTALSTGQALAATDVSASWATMDADANGALSPEEVAGTPWESEFEALDRDGDGEVTKQEFETHMEEMKQSQESDDNM